MLRRIRALFAWVDFIDTGVWLYQINGITGERRAIRSHFGFCQPKRYDWLAGGEWGRCAPPLPIWYSGYDDVDDIRGFSRRTEGNGR